MTTREQWLECIALLREGERQMAPIAAVHGFKFQTEFTRTAANLCDELGITDEDLDQAWERVRERMIAERDLS